MSPSQPLQSQSAQSLPAQGQSAPAQPAPPLSGRAAPAPSAPDRRPSAQSLPPQSSPPAAPPEPAQRSGDLRWSEDRQAVDWTALSALYRIAPLGEKRPEDLRTVFGNSRYVVFVYDGARLVGAGRALADGLDCAYLADIAVHPHYQGSGLGRAVVERLVALCAGHRKILLYANLGKDGFYRKLGFKRMNTAMALFADPAPVLASGLIGPD